MNSLSNFYHSKSWVNLVGALRIDRVSDDGFLHCEHCGLPIVRKYDCIGHHKIPLTESNVNDATVSLNPENIMLVHHVCHNRIHNKLGHIYKQVYLVWGSPLSGKSTYVKGVAEHGDLIVDIDNIWQCLSGCDKYVKPARLKGNVFGIRDTLIDMVRTRLGNWNNAYVIGGYPLSGERERLIGSLGAREIFVECGYDECITRLKICGDGRNLSEWKKYIDDWWRKSGKAPPGQL